ncbi:hypothetical protein F751_1216 [Auxenochlorella protothecoides]|nr:hypothetical protein F751_1216 [Auxenochlorella protothecoides]KFM27439.1 hypothetical protein F751_1216 [Auxenochlorella protothecoides]RMZ54173.1 hypothetical protein APUTEX25_005329 [Auxenochlorella protothecoides]|eukprot:RMZ54173.1 hypothetical protein APUTEX25_005329 [Auxenochlorella protothecoides]
MVYAPHPFFNARNLLEQQTLTTFIKNLNGLAGPLKGRQKPPHLVQFTTQTTVGQALRELAAYNILGAPVIDAATGEYAGIIDVGNILGALVEDLAGDRDMSQLPDDEFVAAQPRLSGPELQRVGDAFTAKTLGRLLHSGELWFKGDAESTLLEVVNAGFKVRLAAGPGGSLAGAPALTPVHHRVAVFDILPGEETPDGPVPAWRITDIVSQTDVVRFLAANLARLDSAFDASVSLLGLVQGPGAVRTLPADAPTLAAFAYMHRHALSGLGVTDPGTGVLVGNLSMSDLRGITAARFDTLALPVGAFLLRRAGRGVDWGRDAGAPPTGEPAEWSPELQRRALVAVPRDTPLREVLHLLVRHSKHRAYVRDEAGRAVGVVTPTDLLRCIAG